jgi:low temperature requirement protein LtrA
LRYAVGVTACQIGWIALLALPTEWWLAGWLVLAPAELAVPMWAERRDPTTWHPHHIAEHYGLLTLIVLGESVLSTTVGIQTALDEGSRSLPLASLIVRALLILFSMWSIYFDQPAHRFLVSNKVAFRWGYGHLVVFASTAAVGAGLGVAIDQLTGHVHLGTWKVGASVFVPVALFVLSVWRLQVRPLRRSLVLDRAFIVGAGLILAASASASAVLLIGLVLSALAAFTIVTRPQHS